MTPVSTDRRTDKYDVVHPGHGMGFSPRKEGTLTQHGGTSHAPRKKPDAGRVLCGPRT